LDIFQRDGCVMKNEIIFFLLNCINCAILPPSFKHAILIPHVCPLLTILTKKMLTWKLFTRGLIILDNPTSFFKKNKKIQKKIWIITVLFSKGAKIAELKNLGTKSSI
jgi:hypothetical protein